MGATSLRCLATDVCRLVTPARGGDWGRTRLVSRQKLVKTLARFEGESVGAYPWLQNAKKDAYCDVRGIATARVGRFLRPGRRNGRLRGAR